MRLGLYGGTFDPIHLGHLHVIRTLLSDSIVDHIIVFPAGQPRLREHAPLASGADRRAMCQLAINDLPGELRSRVEVNPIEILREGPSYTIDTVEAVKQAYPDDQLFWIVGTDAYANLDKWHRIEELKKLVEFIVIDRPEHPGAATHRIGALNVSATQIRQGTSEEIPASVAGYIKEHGLYAS